MPYAGGTVVLVANTASANQLANNVEEFVTRRSWIRLRGVTSAAPVTFVLIVGRTALSNGQSLNHVGTTINLKDHIVLEHAVFKGRIFLTFTSSGTPTVLWAMDIVPF